MTCFVMISLPYLAAMCALARGSSVAGSASCAWAFSAGFCPPCLLLSSFKFFVRFFIYREHVGKFTYQA